MRDHRCPHCRDPTPQPIHWRALLQAPPASALNVQAGNLRVGCSCGGPRESVGIGLSKRPHPLFRLFYQVEIRDLPNSFIKNRNPLTTADPRDSKTRLWPLQDCYIEMLGLPAALRSNGRAVFRWGWRELLAILTRIGTSLLSSAAPGNARQSRPRSRGKVGR
jgi:hypothetical protein